MEMTSLSLTWGGGSSGGGLFSPRFKIWIFRFARGCKVGGNVENKLSISHEYGNATILHYGNISSFRGGWFHRASPIPILIYSSRLPSYIVPSPLRIFALESTETEPALSPF